MKKWMKKLEGLLALGGIKKDIVLLVFPAQRLFAAC